MLISLKQEFLTAADCLVYTAFMGSLAKISNYYDKPLQNNQILITN